MLYEVITGKIAEGDDKSISCTHISEGPYTVLIAEDEAINYLYLVITSYSIHYTKLYECSKERQEA